MKRPASFRLILVPAFTVFLSSACIMVLEIVAGRLIARYLGSSLYTWTSVIGVVLAGITIGNYLGGRIADRFNPIKTLSLLFAVCSAGCVTVIVMNNLLGEWMFLWRLNLPLRVFVHVSLAFLLPSTLLGTISPVVAKLALDQGLAPGRTVGDIYASGAAGSIIGTFVAGFYLIAAVGTIAIIWIIAVVLLLMSILYWPRFWGLYLWAAIFIGLMTMGMLPGERAENAGSALALRKRPDPRILYEDESQYCYIAVERLSVNPEKRQFIQDNVKTQGKIIMNNVRELLYSYMRIFAAVTQRFRQDKAALGVLCIGGGGYVFPRYIHEVWPESQVDVVEIDPDVTQAAIQAFGLADDTAINTINMDARNYVNQLVEGKCQGREMARYDFIYQDAFSGYSVPYQLTTSQFYEKIYKILPDSGVYIVNLVDIYDKGRFLGATLNTLEQTFPCVCVVSEFGRHDKPGNFVVIAAKRQINLENLGREEPVKNDLWILGDSEIESLKNKAKAIVLTDNYAPVENLLAPVAVEGTRDLQVSAFIKQAYELTEQGRWQEAVEAAKSAVEYNQKVRARESMSRTYHNIASALEMLGRDNEALWYLRKAIEGYRQDLARRPNSVEIAGRLGNALAESGNFSEAAKYFQQVVNMNQLNTKNYVLLAEVLVMDGRYDEAMSQLHKGINVMLENNRTADAVELQSLAESVEFMKSKKQRLAK